MAGQSQFESQLAKPSSSWAMKQKPSLHQGGQLEQVNWWSRVGKLRPRRSRARTNIQGGSEERCAPLLEAKQSL